MSFFRKFIWHSPKHYIAAFILCAAVSFVMLWTRGYDKAFFYYDALSAAGGICFFFGLLKLVSYFGAFDTFGYSFGKMRQNGTKRPDTPGQKEHSRLDSLYDYSNAKRAERSRSELTFMPYLLIGLLFLAVAIVIRVFVM